MAGVEARDFTAPHETRTPDKTTVELVNVAGGQIGRYTFEPGWRWSECIKPVVGTDSCQVEHIGYVVTGRCTSSTTTAPRATCQREASTGWPPVTTLERRRGTGSVRRVQGAANYAKGQPLAAGQTATRL